MDIRKIGVLGSGVMGSGIAAHAANAGVPVVLLDIPAKDNPNRNAHAEGAVARMLNAQPSPFLSPERAKLVKCGNLEDDLPLLADADWIIEAVIEKKNIKQDVYRKVDAVRKKGCVLSSNTSTLPLHELMEGLPAHIAEDFCIAHFFNPPRHLRLLEVLKGAKTSAKSFDALVRFADVFLGKEIVPVKDTPGFIANRIGVFWMVAGLNEAMARGIPIEEADAVMGKPIGVPKTGVFGLFDLIGLDLMPLIAQSMLHSLPPSDPFRQLETEPKLLKDLIAQGYTGRKGKGGFTRMRRDGEKRIRESLDLITGEYRAEMKPTSAGAKAKDVKALLSHQDASAEYAWAVLSRTLVYAASLVPEIADDIVSVDAAMREGYNWAYGPFELIDRIGVDAFIARLEKEKRDVPPLLEKARGKMFYRDNAYLTLEGAYAPLRQAPGVLLLKDAKRGAAPLLANDAAALWDLGDGVGCFEITTKMHVFDEAVFDLLEETLASNLKALVIGHDDAGVFSAGANLNYFLDNARSGDFAAIETRIRRGQAMMMQLKFSAIPSVAALSGLALGGGCEMALHCAGVQAHAEAYPGLVEAQVGIVPAWGGCKEMLIRHGNAETPFKLILGAKRASSSDDARAMRVLRESDRVTMNRKRLLADAKGRALQLAEGYAPPKPATIRGGAPDACKAEEGLAPHTKTIGKVLARVLSVSGSEQDVLEAEREGFMELIRMQPSQDRIAHMLETGKPLNN